MKSLREIQLENELEAAHKKIRTLESQIDQMRRHKVYMFATKNKVPLYAGQTKTPLENRLGYHFSSVIFDVGEKQQFHSTLEAELNTGGVYADEVFSNLTDIEADEKEFFLIRKIKQLDPDLIGNIHDGNLTERLANLTSLELDNETEKVYAEAMLKLNSLAEIDLITKKVAHEKAVSRTKEVFSKSIGNCKRTGCPNGKNGLGSNGYCYIGTTNYHREIKKGETLPLYDPTKSTANYNYKNNQAQKALTLSIRDRDPKMGGVRMALLINKILGPNAVKATNIDSNWLQAFGRKSFTMDKYLSGYKNINYSLSSNTVSALVVNEKNFKQTVKEATKRLRKPFEEDKNKFTEDIVQELYDNIESEKNRLKFLFPENPTVGVSKRKVDLKEPESNEKRQKLESDVITID